MSLRDNAEAVAVEEDVSDQRTSFIENDPVIQKLFEDAIEVLRLVGADENGIKTITLIVEYLVPKHRLEF